MLRLITSLAAAAAFTFGFTGGRADPPSSPLPVADKTAADPTEAAGILDAKAIRELQMEHSRARDALLAAEARLALLMEKSFSSRLVVRYRGDLDRPFELSLVELLVDGGIAYRKQFNKVASIQALKLFDAHLPPGRHVLQIRIYARGPDDPAGSQPGFFAGSGLTVHLRANALCEAVFEAEQDGDSPGQAVVKQEEPEGSWEIDIEGSYETTSR